jgi:hypothetical protein
VKWRFPAFWRGFTTAKNAGTGQHPCNIKIYGLCSITGDTCNEAKPVENFGAPETIISMHAGANNAM